LILAIEPASRTVYLKKPLNAMASEIGLTQEALYRAIAAPPDAFAAAESAFSAGGRGQTKNRAFA